MNPADQAIADELFTRMQSKSGKDSLLDMATKQYPILNKYPTQFKMNPQKGRGFLEYWPPGEEGAPNAPRPKEFAPDQYGLEVYDPATRPIDILGDVVSHRMVNEDPTIANAYKGFQASMTPEQHKTLQGQYDYAQKNSGENRPFEDWLSASGMPAAFRGYLFQQWPQEFNDKFYTKAQQANLDEVMNYLTARPK